MLPRRILCSKLPHAAPTEFALAADPRRTAISFVTGLRRGLLDRGGRVKRLHGAKPDGFGGDFVDDPPRRFIRPPRESLTTGLRMGFIEPPCQRGRLLDAREASKLMPRSALRHTRQRLARAEASTPTTLASASVFFSDDFWSKFIQNIYFDGGWGCALLAVRTRDGCRL
jgi:hypothetical protein